MAILTARGVTKRFGGLVAVNKLDFEIAEQRRSSASSARTAPARRPSSTPSPASIRPTRADPVRRRADPQAAHRQDRPPGHLAHLPEYPAVREHDRAGEYPGGQHGHLHSSWLGAVLGTRGPRDRRRRARDEAQRLLDYVDLRGKGDTLARNLPYGDQRRLEVARALATEPQAAAARRADRRHEPAGNRPT